MRLTLLTLLLLGAGAASAQSVSLQGMLGNKALLLVGGGAPLIEDAIREAYATLGDRVVLIDNPQSALSREICLYHAEDTSVEIESPVLLEVGDE